MTEVDAIIGVGGIILTIGLLSVLFYGFEWHKYPGRWRKELDERYVPELLRKRKETEDNGRDD